MDSAPFVDARPIMARPDDLRRRMAEDGYLFVSGLVPRADATAVSEDIMAICREQGWADTECRAACEPVLEGHEGWWDVYDPLQKLESFHALAHHWAIVGLVEALVEEPVLVHPRNIGRITFPGAAHYTTPPHQDRPLIQGAPDTYTAWVPLCDCPRDLGGLAVLAGSHREGLLPVHAATGPGGLAVDTEGRGGGWHTQDMRAGDVLLFHSHTVHRALPNVSDRGLRVSADYRYQGVSQPIVDDSLLPHYMRLDWEEVYRGWTREDLKYYWHRLPITVVPRDPTLTQVA